MAHRHHHSFVLLCSLCVFLPSTLAQTAEFNLPLKAVNLGNWLVTEGWMMPSRFDGLNGQLLDGTQVQFKSTKLRKFLSAENGGGATIVANRDQASTWETFRVWRISDKKFNLRVFNEQFVGLQGQGTTVVAVSGNPSTSETFDIIRNPNNPNQVRFQASNGMFLQVKSLTEVTADYSGGSSWDDTDPSVFEMNVVGGLQGEYQITNGYGPSTAPKLLRDHWNNYITEQDFEFMVANGLTAVRIPVGWWIAYDPAPPMPFVGGSLNALDNAFTWAEKHGMKVIVDLHAAPGSQNGAEHSASRDGYLEWGDSYIQDTVKVIEFLAARYGSHPALVAIELMNEPLAPGIKLEDLIKYYRLGYEAVRRHTPDAYVILSNRIGPADPQELLEFAGGLSRVVIDVHYYNLFDPKFKQWNLQQNIDYIYNDRASDLSKVTPANGPLSFVGEWTSALDFDGATKEDSGKFAKAQQDVYGRATFGWAYWSYRCKYDTWNLKRMIQDGLIKI
ncbi:probable glucan 1,3-beta-glucosidase A isoform X1 [Syzygium oleosum]|uniref:probable glucan 1,3-beta-glucosidase A isoform X1 n=1 Tax=Syzygium oleosum TaxID=219896 RepID=UPI0024BA3443|nr:probable glucan 1,3-beta-glucosidase A isoform X1 [Syzygium oleosum]